MKREFLQGLMPEDARLSKEVIDAIMAENGRDIQAARGAAQEWEEKYNQAVESHRRELEDVRFEAALHRAVHSHGGRNLKAIRALLDEEQLRTGSDDAVMDAVASLKHQCGYLFDEPTPPPYAGGTGTQKGIADTAPTTLAGALKEKFERK